MKVYVLNTYDADEVTGEHKAHKETLGVFTDKLEALHTGEKIRNDTNGQVTYDVLDFRI